MINNDTVKEFVEKNSHLVRRSPAPSHPGLYVLKYKKKVFYDNLWNDFLRDMRGTIVDEDYNVVVMPFRKIYNRGENGTDLPRDDLVTWSTKVNGFMMAATWTERYGVLISTTGSLESPFTAMAKEKFDRQVKNEKALIRTDGINFVPTTWLFEVVHQLDPHVIEETPGLYLLGGRSAQWNGTEITDQDYLDKVAMELGVWRPSWGTGRFSDVVQKAKICTHEGYVVRSQSTGETLKIKSPYYLTTKLFGRMKIERLAGLLDNPTALKEKLDEEYYPLVDELVKNKVLFLAVDEQTKFKFVKDFLNGTANY